MQGTFFARLSVRPYDILDITTVKTMIKPCLEPSSVCIDQALSLEYPFSKCPSHILIIEKGLPLESAIESSCSL